MWGLGLGRRVLELDCDIIGKCVGLSYDRLIEIFSLIVIF